MRRYSSAAVFALTLSLAAPVAAAGVPVAQAKKEQWTAAEKTFRVADDLYDAKRFDEALTAYRASYDIVASPNSRLMVARCLRELGRLAEAYEELESTVTDAERVAESDKKYAKTARAARDELEALKKRVALLEIEIPEPPEGTTLSVGDGTVELDALARPLVLEPGKIKIVAQAPGRVTVQKELTLGAGSSSKLQIDLETGKTTEPVASEPPPPASQPVKQPPPSSSSLRTWAFVAGGVGVAGLATFGIFGALNQSKFHSLESDCQDGHCPPDRSSDIDTGRTYQTVANIGLVVGVVGVGAGVTLFMLGSKHTTGKSRGPWVAVGAGSVRAGGAF